MTLTREEIMSQVPGRTLDIMVAEEVMGYRYKYFERYKMFMWEKSESESASWFPASTDISAAWEVIEKPEIMDRYQIGVYPTSFGTWIARPFMPGGKDCTVQAKTAQEAICKCVLLKALNL